MIKFKYNLKPFQNEDALSYYLLGAFMTDGCVYKYGRNKISYGIALVSKDKIWLEHIKNFICPDINLTQKNNTYFLFLYSTELGKYLISKGCIPQKSLTLKFPNVPIQYLPDFIRGCVDGDGCISFCRNKKNYKGKITIYNELKCYLCSSSIDFISTFKEILNQNEFKYTFTIRKQNISKINNRIIHSTNPHYRVILSGKQAKKFLSWIYYPSNPLSMPRKYDIVKSLITHTIH